MRTFTTKTLTVAVLVLALLASSAPAQASTSPIEEATVNLYCRIKLGGGTYSISGSGAFINKKGIILTNAHVAQFFLLTEGEKSKATCAVRTGSPAKEQYSAELLYLSPAWATSYTASVKQKKEAKGTGERDFALLAVTKAKKGMLPSSFPALPIREATFIAENMPVSVAGYPSEGQGFSEVKNKLKQEVAESAITDVRSFAPPSLDLLVLAPSSIGKGGVSGGPVTDSTGTLIGIATTVSGKKTASVRSLHAVSVTHMEYIVKTETGLTLALLEARDLAVEKALLRPLLPADFAKTLQTGLRRIR